MRRFVNERRIMLYLLFLFLLTTSCAPKKLEDQIKAYQEAHNSGNVKQKLSCCTEDVRYIVEGEWTVEGKKELRGLFESDAVLNSNIVLTDLKVDGSKITCKITEQSDWLKAAEIDTLNYEFGQFTFEKGLIKEVRVKYSQRSTQAVQEYRASFGKWASENRSQEFDELKSTGVITKKTVDMYLRLLREWREDIEKEEQ